MNNLCIRKMAAFEMKIALDWADREGWNPGLHDEECFYNADPEGYFVGVLGKEIVSMISAVKYDSNYGFIGFYIVAPPYRGKAYGIPLWNTALNYLDNSVVGLDGVPAQVKNYEKSGFVKAHRNITFKGLSGHFDIEIPGLRQLSINDFKMIRSYDKEFIPDTRDKFLRCWISQDDSFVLGIVEGKKLTAYGKIRACREGFKIGPLFSDNQANAEKMFIALNNMLPKGSSFTIDVPELNRASLRMVESYGMEYFFETARMYKSGMPRLDLNKIYGVTTYELG
jgi:GNAT superfamily N-acetyltransferase